VDPHEPASLRIGSFVPLCNSGLLGIVRCMNGLLCAPTGLSLPEPVQEHQVGEPARLAGQGGALVAQSASARMLPFLRSLWSVPQ
jgi:hypothetical protein